jgi:Rrf2 family protein
MRLQLNKRTDYAIRACLYLASESRNGLVSGRRIAEHMEIPERFLPRVLSDLTHAGIVEAQIGRSGGYRLQEAPERISILQLIETIEGASRSDVCVLRQRGCDARQPCAFHPVWDAAQTAFISALTTATLADLTTGRPRPDGSIASTDALNTQEGVQT